MRPDGHGRAAGRSRFVGGIERARGLSDFTSEEIRVLINNPDTEAEQLLGYRTKGEIVRSSNLVPLETRHLLWDAPEGVLLND